MKKINSRGQITVFVIIAILIVVVLIFAFYKPIKGLFIGTTPADIVPTACIEKAVDAAINNSMMAGGKINSQLYFNYNNIKIAYSCYTAEWYKTCVMQIPLLKQAIEDEAGVLAQKDIDACFSDAVTKLENKGYNVKTSGTKKATINFQPGKIIVTPDFSAAISKDNTAPVSYSAERFKTILDSNAYDLVMIGSSIQNFEAHYGDSEIITYMSFYPNIKVEKIKQLDGTKIYIISDRNTKEMLQFATRSQAWPPGLALSTG